MGIPILGDIAKVVGKVIDKIVPDKAKAMELKHEINMQLFTTDMAQIDVNKKEAEHASVFVAGWRPAVGWVCVAGLAFNFVIAPLLAWGCAIWAPTVIIPVLDMSELLTLLFGMLGMGTIRSFDKANGVARNSIDKKKED